MKMILYILLFQAVSLLQSAQGKLEAAVVLFRHGARGAYRPDYDVNHQFTGRYKLLTEVGAR